MEKNISLPLINRLNLQELYGTYEVPEFYSQIPMTPYVPLDISGPTISSGEFGGIDNKDPLNSWLGTKATTPRKESGVLRRRSQLIDESGRFPYYMPEYDNEDAYGQNQGWTTKMFNGATKGLSLTGTTFLQTTVGAVNGLIQYANTGDFTSFYNNEFNRSLDEFNKQLENSLPTYETKEFREAKWYSPDYLFTGNFVWEGIVKNLGFAAGAALSGVAFSGAISWAGKLANMSRLTAAGRVGEALTKAGMIAKGSEQANKITAMSNNFLSAYKTLSTGERIVVAGLSTTGEAGIEAYHNLNDYRDRAIDAFEKEFKRGANKEELEIINKAADGVGNSSFFGNMLLLSATNYIQFPKILGSSYKAEKGIFNDIAKKTRPIIKEGDKFIAKAPSKIQKLGRAISNPYVFSYSEAFEEGSQFAIGKSSEDYYDKKYNNEDFDIWSSLYKGIEETITSNEGMKNILIGGLSGALMLGRGKWRQSNRDVQNTSDALRSNKWENTGLNSAGLSEFMNDTYDSVVRGATIQKERENYTAEGDILNSKDAEADYIINYLAPRIKHGRFDLVTADIKDYENLASSELGWQQLQKDGIAHESDTKEAFITRLQGLKNTAENVKSLYQSLNVKYKGAINEDGKRLYDDVVIDKMVYAASKIADYSTRYNQLSMELMDDAINLSDITASAIIKDDGPLNKALKDIESKQDITETEKEELAIKLKAAVQIAVRKHNFVQEYDSIFKNPEKHSEKTREDIKDVNVGEKIKVKTGKVEEKEVTIGEPYYLVENYKPSVDGVRATRKAHKVQLLKQNEDGSVEIQFANGVVKTVSPEELSKFNLGKVSDTQNNKKAKFVLEHLDETFTNYGVTEMGYNRKGFRKDDAPAEGVLEYNSEEDQVYFVWTDSKGKTKTRKVTGSMFKAQEEYNGAMIRETGERLTKNKAKEDSKKAFLSLEEKIGRRTEVVNELYENLLKEITAIANKIQANNKRLTSLDEEISNAYKTKSGKPRKRITKTILNVINELEKLRETIPAENERLQEQQMTLEGELEYVKSFADSVESTPGTGIEMIDNLKKEMEDLKDLIGLTKDSIKRTEQQLPLLEAIYKRALKLLNNFIERMVSLNPSIPISIEDYKISMSSKLGDAVAEGIIERNEGFTSQVLDIENTILSYTEGLNFPKYEKQFLNMSRDLKEMKNSLKGYEDNLRAQEKILEAFRDFWREEQAKKKVEEVLVNNTNTDQVLDATLETDGATMSYDPDFTPTPLKATHLVTTATRGVDFGKEDQKRANTFGFNLPKLQKEGKDIQAVYVTSSTEEELGIPGLMSRIAEDNKGNVEEKVDQDDIIAVVMVTDTEDGLKMVDVNGNLITGDNPLDQAIWQVMPAGSLVQHDGTTMFRPEKDGGPNKETRKALINKYKKWRKDILGRAKIDTAFTPEASFGRLQYEQDENGDNVYDLRTPVVDAGFLSVSEATIENFRDLNDRVPNEEELAKINNDVLISKKVLKIPTKELSVSKGTTEFKSKSEDQALYKRVLLETDNGYVQVKNQKVSENQSNVILKSLKFLAQELVEKETLSSIKSLALLSYLKGVIYFGIPHTQKGKAKPKATNSVFFKKDKTTGTQWLYIGKTFDVEFTPTELRNKSGAILEALQDIYANTNAAKVREKGETFVEILDMSDEGEITKTRTWPNYQSYLLSKFLPTEDGDGFSKKERANEDIPLVTSAKPITESEPVNRKDIYFYNERLEENYTTEEQENLNFRALKEARNAIENKDSVHMEEIVEHVNSFFPGLEETLSEIKNKDSREDKYRRYFIFSRLKDLFEETKEYNDLENTLEKQKFLKEQLEILIEKNLANKKSLQEILDHVNNKWLAKAAKPTPEERKSIRKVGIKTTPTETEETKGENINTENSEEDSQEQIEQVEETEEETKPEVKRKTIPIRRPRGRVARGRKNGGARIQLARSRAEDIENWKTVESWLKDNFPNVPLYRMQNIIKNTAGDRAWGLFRNGAMYVYKNAEAGTAFHEVFEAVWAVFATPEEKTNTLNEFKSRSGSFTDRPSQQIIAYKDATDEQAKEELAEEFRHYVLKTSLPQKTGKNIILKAFKDFITFIKKLINKVIGRTEIENLFKKINTGGFKNQIPQGLEKVQNIITDSSEDLIVNDWEGEWSKLPPLTDTQIDDTVTELIYRTIGSFLQSGNGLFNLVKVDASDKALQQHIWNAIKILKDDNQDFYSGFEEEGSEELDDYKGLTQQDVTGIYSNKKEVLDQLTENIEKEWPTIKQRFSEKIQWYGLEVALDENDKAQITAEDKTRNSDYINATKVDKFKKMNQTLKLIFSSVAKTESYYDEESGEVVPHELLSSIGGVQTLPFTTVTNTLMKKLHKSVDVMDMLNRFRELAKENTDYRILYEDFTGLDYSDEVNLSKIKTTQDVRLISGLWKTFSLAAPAVKNVFILEDGEVEIGDASLSTEAMQLRNDFINTITLKTKSGSGFFKYSSQYGGIYVIDKDELSKFKLDQFRTSHSKFLNKLGIDFSVEEMRKLSKEQWKALKAINSGLRLSLNKLDTLKSFSSKSLDLHKQALLLGLLKASVSNPSFESTYFNVSGERTQTFIGTNATDRLYKILSQTKNIKHLEGTEYEYLIFGTNGRNGKDTFTQNSALVKAMFDKETGERKDVDDDQVGFLTNGYAGGTINNIKGKNITSSKLKFRDRLVQELNLNLEGWYMNLVPGDSSTEWMTYISNFITSENLAFGYEKTFNIMKGYFIDEVNLSREKNRDVYSGNNPKDLRFFKDILDESTLTTIRRSYKADPADLYENNKEAIEKAIISYIKKNSANLDKMLNQYGLIEEGLSSNRGKKTIANTSLGFLGEERFNHELDVLSINYMIANIEMHKVLYGDPYQYKDELKRTKSFQSPRQEILNSSEEINEVLHEIYNKKFKKGSFGYTNFLRDYFKTVTFSDVEVVAEMFPAFGKMEETDGGGIIDLNAYRNFKIRASDWTDGNELQYEYEMKYYELYKEGKIEQAKKLKNPQVRDTFTAIKPVVTGNRKHSGTHNKIVLDKYSLYPISFRMMIEMGAKNGAKLYDKMQNEDIDYVIFETGRKVGAYNTVDPYDADGNFVSTPFEETDIINIPFYSMGLQTEVPSKDKNSITRGSQVTKIITMDRMDAGMPIDFLPEEASFPKRYKLWKEYKTDSERAAASPLFKEILNNRRLLQAMTEFGYANLLQRLGISETTNKFGEAKWEIKDITKTAELVKKEVLRRDTNINITQALDSFIEGSVVLEATPAYRQISNILYAIVDENIASPKINGSMKVQLPSTFWEEKRIGISEFNGKKGYTSDALNFYSEERDKDGKRVKVNVMEIYASRWFKSDMSDEDLLKYLNDTVEGQKILEGFAFRIPTQNMNSVDAFRIKAFTPEEFGDNVVVPSAIVGKVGSDFDIDKLSMYFKNVFKRWDGKPVLVPHFEIGNEGFQDALNYAKNDLRKTLEKFKIQLDKKVNLQGLFGDMAIGMANTKTMSKWIPIFKEWYSDILNDNNELPVRFIEDMYMDIAEKLGKQIDNLTNQDLFTESAYELAKKLYSEGLQNAYIESNINLLTRPDNYEKLTSPNDASLLVNLSEELVKARGETVLNYKTPINMLDRTFMTQLRHDFVAGKQGISIAAVGQANNAINQLTEVVVDVNKLSKVDPEEKRWLGDGSIKFSPSKYNFIVEKGKRKPTLSMRKNAAGDYISDILGMFIDGFVDIANGPWIMRLGATPEVVATWLFLVKAGVPIKDVAYFINQPIIREYLQMIQNKGYSWLFIDTYVKDLKDKYSSVYNGKIDVIPSVTELKKTINKDKLNTVDNAYQKFYLDEFLKYSMMGRHLFYFVQGTNYDTASFNNPYLLTKKAVQFKKAQQSIISDADEVLENSFLGTLKNRLLDAREALTEVLISDRPTTREVVSEALEPYSQLNDRDYVKMVEKVITNLFDWAVQTHKGINQDLIDILVKKGNITQRMSAFIKEIKADPQHTLSNNYLIENTQIIPSKSAEPGSPDNIKIKALSSEIYEHNRMTYAFKELKEYLKEDPDNSDLYAGLIKLAILQNGLSPSTLSFTSYIPFEDFEPFYNEALSLLEERVNLNEFNTSNIFQRNNWNNNDIAPYISAGYIASLEAYNPGMDRFRPKQVTNAVNEGDIADVVQLSVGMDTKSDFIVYTWEDNIVLDEDELNLAKRGGKEFIKEANSKKKEEMRNAGDYSFKHKALMKKVYKDDGITPYVHEYYSEKKDITYYSHVYRAINAWGMGNRANEFWEVNRPSVLNNGFDKYAIEGSDKEVIELYQNPVKSSTKKSLGLENLAFNGAGNARKVKNGTKTTTLRSYKIPDGMYDVEGTRVKVTLRGYLTVEEAGGVEAISKSENFGPNGPLFPKTKKWLKGVGKMYVYDLEAPTKTAKSTGDITIKGDNVKIGYKTIPLSYVNTKKLLSLGYTIEQANNIINVVNDPLKGCE